MCVYHKKNVILLDIYLVLFIDTNLMQNKIKSFIDCNVRDNKRLRTVCDSLIFP